MTRYYNETCAPCHGQNGEGGGAGTRTFNTRDLFDQKHDRRYFDAIKKGVPEMAMPAYGGVLSDEEIWAQVVHVRELQGRALRASEGSPKPDGGGVYRSQRAAFRVEDVLTGGLATPWSLDFLPDGRMLVTNRPGTMHVIGKDGKLGPAITGVPQSVELGQGGLMEVAVHPDFRPNGWIYLSLADPKKDGSRGAMTKIVRGKLSGNSWMGQETIWEAAQEFYNGAGVHFGSKIVFDGKGHTYFSVGERGSNERSLDPKIPFGKIYRLNDDGTEPKDNPWAGQAGVPKGLWSLGHRNQQGLTIGLDGRVWDTEHAPRGGDEVNEIIRGANYGWPIVGHGINYQDTPRYTPYPEISAPDQKITTPIFRWMPSTGASGLDVARGNAFPEWKGDLLAGGLVGQNLDRIRTKEGKLIEREELVHGMGRIRDVAVAPDGAVYLVLNGPDKVVRLVPAK